MSNFKETARCTGEPQLTYIPGSGTAVCKFSIAVDRYNAKKLKDEGKQSTDFIPQVAFGKTAEFLAQNLKKGEFVQVEGDVQITKGNDDKYYTSVKINSAKIITWGEKKESGGNFNYGIDPSEFQAIENDDMIPF